MEPALWLWAPDDTRDKPWRKFQHLYWPLPFSLTFLLWRIDSVRTALKKGLKLEVRQNDGMRHMHTHTYCEVFSEVSMGKKVGGLESFLG